MLGLFDSAKSSLLKLETVTTDNPVFRLHYKVTFAILVTFTILVTSKQYIGDPIDCIVEGISPDIMDTYCWIHSTFTVPEATKVGQAVAHPGVKQPDEEEVMYHKYYQWVVFMLFFQAMMFYIPRYIWKTAEKGRLSIMTFSLTVPIVDEKTKTERLKLLREYYVGNLGKYNMYGLKFAFCEFLNFANVVFQIYFTDVFLGGHFRNYAPYVFSFQRNETDYNHFAKIFPIVSKCTFHRFGASGTIQRIDGLCVLPVNILNEKIYLFLWIWFVTLSIISGLALIYRLITLISPGVRLSILQAIAPLADKKELRGINQRCQFGDWFILNRLAKNLDSHIYREFVSNLYEQIIGIKA
ncbi:innexin inx2-like [Artemia franciscana]|uniref:Innexin n=1 Tax=Artemia franciscana TaxID=6661 RepID=A0AA88HR56_ARTSF|nr:hypothetical protein QYM36_013857 [Artemia franciscana]